MGGKSLEAMNMMDRGKLEVLCVQETKWKGDRARALVGGCKTLHAGRDGKKGEWRDGKGGSLLHGGW